MRGRRAAVGFQAEGPRAGRTQGCFRAVLVADVGSVQSLVMGLPSVSMRRPAVRPAARSGPDRLPRGCGEGRWSGGVCVPCRGRCRALRRPGVPSDRHGAAERGTGVCPSSAGHLVTRLLILHELVDRGRLVGLRSLLPDGWSAGWPVSHAATSSVRTPAATPSMTGRSGISLALRPAPNMYPNAQMAAKGPVVTTPSTARRMRVGEPSRVLPCRSPQRQHRGIAGAP